MPSDVQVTGANKGIGYETVAELCRQVSKDTIVYLTARSVARGEAAVAELNKTGLTAKFHQLDIGSASSIDAFATYIETEHGGLDVLVNNAGIAFKVVVRVVMLLYCPIISLVCYQSTTPQGP